jgi:hypothetical protein
LGEPYFASKFYKAYPFDIKSFHAIKLVQSNRRLAFVDGGNQELLGAPNFSIQLNRIYFNIFDGRLRINKINLPQRIEFFSATVSTFKGDKMFYETAIFPAQDEHMKYLPVKTDVSFPSTDKTIRGVGRQIADISKIASIARRFAEWSFAKHVVKEELNDGDIIVMDGTLGAAFTNESKYRIACYEAAKAKGVVFTGLAKTSRLFTTTGLSLLGAISEMSNENGLKGPWYYYPIADSLSPEHNAVIFAINLHEQAQRVFRYEIQADRAKKLTDDELYEIFSQLSVNSSDLSFPGYPYGLIDADDNARVRYSELETYRMILLSEISKLGSWPKFVRHVQASDAHDVLNFLKEGM